MKNWMLLIVLILFSSSLLAVEVESVEKKTYKMRPGGYVTVIGDNGFISVKSWEREEVEVVITKRVWDRSRSRAEARLKDLTVDITQRADRLVIRYLGDRRERGIGFFDLFDADTWDGYHSPEIDFELMVPREVDLRLENDEGDIEVFGVSGDFSLHVDEGDLIVGDIAFRDFDGVVDEGNVEISDFNAGEGRLSVEADEGEITLKDGIVERLEVSCDEGDIVIQDMEMQNCTISTDEGDLEIDIRLEMDGEYSFDTDEGNIRVWLDDDPDVELKLDTEDGAIRDDFRLSVEEHDDGERVTAVLGRGSARVQAFTDEGDIILRRR